MSVPIGSARHHHTPPLSARRVHENTASGVVLEDRRLTAPLELPGGADSPTVATKTQAFGRRRSGSEKNLEARVTHECPRHPFHIARTDNGAFHIARTD